MSSIIMHLYISKIMQEELNLSNKFLAGSILPDMIKIKTQKRDETHYIKEYPNYKRLPELDRFLRENKDKLNDEVMLGYYAHLIEDYVWFDKYIGSFAKCIDKKTILYLNDNTIHDSREFALDIYSDYHSVDSYLIKEKHLDIDKIRIDAKGDLKEYDIDDIIDDNVKYPMLLSDAIVKFISKECLDNYINDSLKMVREKILEILGE